MKVNPQLESTYIFISVTPVSEYNMQIVSAEFLYTPPKVLEFILIPSND